MNYSRHGPEPHPERGRPRVHRKLLLLPQIRNQANELLRLSHSTGSQSSLLHMTLLSANSALLEPFPRSTGTFTDKSWSRHSILIFGAVSLRMRPRARASSVPTPSRSSSRSSRSQGE